MKARDYAALMGAAAKVEWAKRLGRPTIPYKLEFITTFSCQSRCRTCNIWKRYITDPEEQSRELRPEQIIQTVLSARDHVRWISLTGGEVTDRPDFIEIVQGIIDAVGDKLSLFQITTNGIDPEKTAKILPEVIRIARPIPTYITLSLDGIGKTYERVRGVPNGYEKVKQSMAILKAIEKEESHLTTGYQITLSELNVHEAAELFEDASFDHERPIVTMATNALQLTGGKADIDVRRAGVEVEEALADMWRRYPRSAVNDLPPAMHLGLTQRFFKTGRAPVPCAAGHATVTIDPYGGVLQCDSRATALARLQDFDFDLVAMCQSDAFRAALEPLSGCRECWTPCQAYPSILHNPVASTLEYAKAKMGL
jgi:MoaA/NifB/PqqE/SkfB family radical SAM enzyme